MHTTCYTHLILIELEGALENFFIINQKRPWRPSQFPIRSVPRGYFFLIWYHNWSWQITSWCWREEQWQDRDTTL